MPHLCIQSHSHALPRHYFAHLTIIMPWEGVGVALGAQVGHVVTYRDSPEGSLIYTVFTKKCQKWTKRGTPYFFNRKIYGATY